MSFCAYIGKFLRRTADRIDPENAMSYPNISLMFVKGVGAVTVPDNALEPKFCPLAYARANHDLGFKPDANGQRNDYYTLSDIPKNAEPIVGTPFPDVTRTRW